MNYFQAYLPSLDEAIVAAWESQVAEAAEAPWLAQALAAKSADLFPRFAATYAQLRALPRGARRVLQRRLARSGELAIPPEWQRKLAGSIAGAALLLALGQGTTQAATITVTTNKPGILVDTKCSLIEAIENANDTATGAVHADCTAGDPAAADTIILPASKAHTLTSPQGLYYLTYTGLPLVTSTITIEGNGGKIVRKKTAPTFRLLDVGPTGNLTLRNVTLSGGRADDDGGGVNNEEYSTLIIEDSTISGNSSGDDGGGIGSEYNGTITIINSTISKNKSAEDGGGIDIERYSTATITNSTISKNQAAEDAGGVNIEPYATVTITNSTISGNKAGDDGGGIDTGYQSTLTVENSTISGNKAGDDGGGINNDFNATVTVNNSTIASNKAANDGGGIANDGSLNLNRSLISGNKGGPGAPGREVYNYTTGTVTAANYNIFGVSNISGLFGFTEGATDIVGPVALGKIIGPLKNNGGPTQTRALAENSPAIDIIPLLDPGCTSPTTDQRGAGFPRPVGPGCDIGAFEKQ